MRPLSPELQAVLRRVVPHAERPPPPSADDLPAWRALQQDIEERAKPACEVAVAHAQARLIERRVAGMPAIEIVPPNAREIAPAIFLHGGAYTGFSARSSLFASAPIARQLARRVIALDYPLAPHAEFRTIVPETGAAIAAICATNDGAALIGDSAGGGLALAATRHALAAGACPRVLALISPWTDLTNTGVSHRTHAARDLLLAYEPGLRVSAAAYAGDELSHPDASPLFADYDETFPPALIICGSEEILLSDSTRMRDALDHCGAELSVFDGLFHSFAAIAPQAPESQAAIARIRAFIEQRH